MTASEKWRARADGWLSLAALFGEGDVRNVLIRHASAATVLADELDATWLAALTGERCQPKNAL